MRIALSEIVQATNGIIHSSSAAQVTGVAIDSRNVQPGDLFVPILGDNVDGHDFLAAAVQNGAVASLWSRETLPEILSVPLIAVDSTVLALQNLSIWYRKQMKAKIIGVTGSVGKTSTKDITASLLRQRFRVLANKGNLNTEIGLPLTLFNLSPDVDYAVLEMGMRGPGQITRLAQIASPLVGVITNIGESHIELLGTREAIASAKGELLEALPTDGWAVLNGDDPLVVSQAGRSNAPVIYYGIGSDKTGTLASASELHQQPDGRMRFRLQLDGAEAEATLAIPGRHNVHNALAAAAVAHCLGLSLEEVVAGLASVELTKMRCEVVTASSGATIINDAYNACFDSMRAGLDLLSGLKTNGRTIAILGDMLELGNTSQQAHRRVGTYAAETGIDLLITLGQHSRDIAKAALENGLSPEQVREYSFIEEAIAFIRSQVTADDVILVKGSRGMKMEQIVRVLMEE